LGNDLNMDHNNFVSLRCRFPDLYSDMYLMALHAITVWGKPLLDAHFDGTLDATLEQLRAAAAPKAETSNRLYVTTEFFYPALIAPDLSAETIRTIEANTAPSPFEREPYAEELLAYGRNCVMVWLFRDRLMTMARPITPTMAAEMIAAFSQENLLSLNWIRPHWSLPS